MKKTEIAYIAGIVDGEGYIGIKRATNKANGCINPTFHEKIQIRMVDEQAIAFIANCLGGNYYRESASAAHGRPLYCFSASDLIAVRILRVVRPYLRVKLAVAEVVLEHAKARRKRSWISVQMRVKGRWGMMDTTRRRLSPKYIADCEQRWLRCKKLNRVGV